MQPGFKQMARVALMSAFFAGAIIFSSSTAFATVSISSLDPNGRFAHLSIAGDITAADAKAFAKLVGNVRTKYDVVDVDLNSRGGDVLAAMQIGRVIRANSIWTTASDEPGNICASACVLILASGVARMASDDSDVEIHRPYYEPHVFAKLPLADAQRLYGELTNDVQMYLARMGMSGALFQEMLQVPSDQGRTLNSEEMARFGLVGWDPAYQEWLKARNATR